MEPERQPAEGGRGQARITSRTGTKFRRRAVEGGESVTVNSGADHDRQEVSIRTQDECAHNHHTGRMSPATPRAAAPSRRRLLPPRPEPGSDLGFALILLFAEGVVWVYRAFIGFFTLGTVTPAELQHSRFVFADWEFGMALAALVVALVAAYLRAPRTACIQLLVAVVLGLMGLSTQHPSSWDTHAPPTPTNSYYVPCYSGTDCERN
jgi:hypothetical protein